MLPQACFAWVVQYSCLCILDLKIYILYTLGDHHICEFMSKSMKTPAESSA